MIWIFFVQFWQIFKKNFILGWRSRELMAEVGLPIVTGILMVVKNIIFPIQFLAPIIVALAINTSSRSLLIRLVEEKSNRYKEVQKIMGLSQSAYFLAWYLSAVIRTMMSAALFLVLPFIISDDVSVREDDLDILKMGNYKGFWDIKYNDKVSEFIVAYVLYVFAATNQAFAISTLFSNPKLAGEFATFITTLTALLSFLIFNPSFIETPYQFIVVSMSPQACIAFAYIASVKNPIYHENFELANDSYMLQYPLEQARFQMLTLIFFYCFVYVYLEKVTPNEYGISSHPFFFIECLWKRRQKKQNLLESQIPQFNNQQIIQDQMHNSQIMEDDRSSARYHQKFINLRNSEKTIQIDGLTKDYGPVRAVNHLSLSLYNKNIFCLLGHNGSGKTTTISLLTGLIEKSKGNIEIFGKQLESNLTDLRKSIGICTQREVLYDDMTFEEHLSFIGRIKGISLSNLKGEIEKVIDMTKTQKERKKLSKQLSGGNKRKLSLCMALIGGSKVVFLDEPTSGIDAISRRAIWDILEYVRTENRTIILTTHHLDEAEVLADRIGILAKGRLLAVGTNDFMKKNFGIGYTLSVFPDIDKIKQENQLENNSQNQKELQFTEQDKEKIVQIVKSKIPDAVLNPQSNMNSLIFMVSFSSQKFFVDLFQKLEEQEGYIINLEMNSLEDAFVNIGMDEDKFFRDKNEEEKENLQKNLNDIKDNVEQHADAKYTYFNDIEVPECLKKPPTYRFISQFTACFLRKFYCTYRNFTNYVSFSVPLFLMLLAQGVIVNAPEEGPAKLVLLGIFIAIAYSFNGGIYIVQPVQEREENLKYSMNVMGCRVVPFWLGTFFFDYIIYGITVFIFLVYAGDQGYTYITNYQGIIFKTLMAFGVSLITFSYMCGYILFTKSSSAMKGFPAINFFVVFIMPWALLGIFYYLNYEDEISLTVQLMLEKICVLIYFLFSPLYVLSKCFEHMEPVTSEVFVSPFYSYSEETNFYIWILIFQAIVYSSVTYILEQKRYNLMPKNKDQLQNMKINNITDEEVIAEKDRVYKISKQEKMRLLNDNNDDVEQQNFEEKDKIIVRNLWKKYENNYVALKNVSYGVKKGEIMGLLGPNGAGKSTSFNILTALIPRTMGSVTIKDYQVNRGIMNIYQDVGICPQFDCVWTSLTPKEHLYLFGRMKGLYGVELDQAVKYFLQVTQLTAFVKTKAGNLSGGNKRKLCVACALIGGPDVQFFDEPSTGVDPIARRFLWHTLKQGAKLRNSAIVLTTHTMLEAESLCTKIGILINGQFYCLGTPQQLRNKHGNGYTITVQAKQVNLDTLQTRLTEIFPDIKVLPEKREQYYAFQVGNNQFSFFKGYKLCEQLKEEEIIQDFSINQCTLEQVFLRFSKFQEVNPQLK